MTPGTRRGDGEWQSVGELAPLAGWGVPNKLKGGRPTLEGECPSTVCLLQPCSLGTSKQRLNHVVVLHMQALSMGSDRIECVYGVTGPLLGFIKIGCWRGSLCNLHHRYKTAYGIYKLTTYRCTGHRIHEKLLHGYLGRYQYTGELYALAALPEFHNACRIICDDTSPDETGPSTSHPASERFSARQQRRQQRRQLQQTQMHAFVEARCVAHAGKFVPSQRLFEAYCEWADADMSMHAFCVLAKPILEDKGARNHKRRVDGVDKLGYTFASLQDLQTEQPQHHEDGGHNHLEELQPCSNVRQQQQQTASQRLQTQMHAFVEARCVAHAGKFVPSQRLFEAYCEWADADMSMHAFCVLAKPILEDKGARSHQKRVDGVNKLGYTFASLQDLQTEQPQHHEDGGHNHLEELQPCSNVRQQQQQTASQRLQTQMHAFVEARCVAHAGKFVPSQRLFEAYCEWADADMSMHAFCVLAKPILEDKGARSHQKRVDGVNKLGYTFASLQDLQTEQPQHHEDGGHNHLEELQPCSNVRQQQQQTASQRLPAALASAAAQISAFVEARCVAHAGKFVPSQRLLEAYCEWADADMSMKAFCVLAKPILEDKGARNHKRRVDGVDKLGYTFASLQDCK